MAANFKRFEEDNDLFPNLKWIPSTSAEPRAIHTKLYGIVKPMYDAFWVDNYPGNLWGCKCGITNTDAEVSAETLAVKRSTEAAPGLDKNPVSGQIFTDTHPYVTEAYVSKRKLMKICKAAAKKLIEGKNS